MQERMNIVIVGHVDHGKSTVIGRLLADTGSLPDGKLEQVKATCARNSKPFEYAFLLDALKDEQAQGITIDAARCFFKTQKRHYIVIDAPGHIEFLKNMVTGAANAEAALIVIDSKEGIRENTKRHGYLVSMLGIKKVVVVVNKMDLIHYDQATFEAIQSEYSTFLQHLNVEPIRFIPISAMEGENLARPATQMPWYQGPSVLAQLDALEKSRFEDKFNLPFRFPVQDIYKFTEDNDDRRIFAGTIETGTVKIGDQVTFWPSQKSSKILSIEEFNVPTQTQVGAGKAVGFTLETQIYVRAGELMTKNGETPPLVSSQFRANLFWMGKAPLIQGKRYKMKIGTKSISVQLAKILNILDASELTTINKTQVDRHDVGECVFETIKPIAYDLSIQNEATGRFVLVDNYEIAGGGIILERLEGDLQGIAAHVKNREAAWEHGLVRQENRAYRFGHKSKFVLFTGNPGTGKRTMAKALEQKLFEQGFNAYYLGSSSLSQGLDSDMLVQLEDRTESIRRVGELARILTDAGQIFITTLVVDDGYDLKQLQLLNAPNEILVIHVGEDHFTKYKVHLNVAENENAESVTEKACQLLRQEAILEYHI